jgi:hypothetical protein
MKRLVNRIALATLVALATLLAAETASAWTLHQAALVPTRYTRG